MVSVNLSGKFAFVEFCTIEMVCSWDMPARMVLQLWETGAVPSETASCQLPAQ